MLKDKRGSLYDMVMALHEAEWDKLHNILDYCINRENDKETTVFEAVRDMFEDCFYEDLEQEERYDRDYWDKADEAYERKRDEEMMK